VKVHIAGYYQNRRKMFETKHPYFLESYHYLHLQKFEKLIRNDGVQVFLDSGAFSMFTQGANVDLEAYAQWIKDNQDIIRVASNLDVIGAGNETGSYDNQRLLEALGVQVQPVHHARDADQWLERYLAEGYDYIFLGGMVPETTKYLRGWLDHIWDKYLADADGMPKVKVHGFGLTTLELMERYPWESVDSISWLLMASFGGCLLRGQGGKVHNVKFSTEAPQAKKLDAHYDTLAPVVQGEIRELVEAQGFEVDQLRSHYSFRDQVNINFFTDLCDRPVRPFKRQQRGLF
jgi:hypothetical protein